MHEKCTFKFNAVLFRTTFFWKLLYFSQRTILFLVHLVVKYDIKSRQPLLSQGGTHISELLDRLQHDLFDRGRQPLYSIHLSIRWKIKPRVYYSKVSKFAARPMDLYFQRCCTAHNPRQIDIHGRRGVWGKGQVLKYSPFRGEYRGDPNAFSRSPRRAFINCFHSSGPATP